MSQDFEYKVSVSIITYNQAGYIEKAIDSAIDQEVDFPYEIIIGDDCSTDGTREILLDYKRRYPDLIKLNLHDEHYEGIPGRLNNITNIRSAKGKYIAFCDGDDYWISKGKLQKQADFMDANRAFSCCCNDVWLYDERNQESYYKSNRKFTMRSSHVFTQNDVIQKKLFTISSNTFFRRKYFNPLPDWFWNVYSADYFLYLLALQHGDGMYFKGIKTARIVVTNSVSLGFFRGNNLLKVKKNDNEILRKAFNLRHIEPYSYKALFYLSKAKSFNKNNEYLKVIYAIGQVIRYDWRVGLNVIKNKIAHAYSFITFYKS